MTYGRAGSSPAFGTNIYFKPDYSAYKSMTYRVTNMDSCNHSCNYSTEWLKEAPAGVCWSEMKAIAISPWMDWMKIRCRIFILTR